MNESVLDQLRKIARLAESGVAGERDNAKSLLDKLCAKYKVAPETLLSSEKRYYKFAFSSKFEERLLVQCYAFVMQTVNCRARRRRGSLGFSLTEAEHLALSGCYNHYRKEWRVQLKAMATAFYSKHKLFGPSSGSESEPISPEELERILALMRGLQSKQWQRPAAALTESRTENDE